MQPNPTLDQLQVFLAVADTGSFSAAARHLNRSQSVIVLLQLYFVVFKHLPSEEGSPFLG